VPFPDVQRTAVKNDREQVYGKTDTSTPGGQNVRRLRDLIVRGRSLSWTDIGLLGLLFATAVAMAVRFARWYERSDAVALL
jgi:hypothetical protein